jgi:hypothetical protein
MAGPFIACTVRTATLVGPNFGFFGNCRNNDGKASGYDCLQLQGLSQASGLRRDPTLGGGACRFKVLVL